ncbi:MAG: hypothetical protein HZA92_08650 [Verrucomicrobia bacterium]|nr:hypothetical protein [Verrucomicrobiota bacterium]
MVNPFKEVNWNPDRAALRTFARSLVIGFPCVAVAFLLAGLLAGKGWNLSFALKLGGGGAAAGALFYVVPAIARPFYIVWYALACCVGIVVGNVLLGLIFYVLVTGIGFLKRLGGRQPIRKTPDRQASTYWVDAPPAPEAKRYYRQF